MEKFAASRQHPQRNTVTRLYAKYLIFILIIIQIHLGEDVHVHEMILVLRAFVADDAFRKRGEGVICLHWNMARNKAVYNAFFKAGEVLFQIIETYDNPVGRRVLAQIISEKKNSGVGHSYVPNSRMLFEKRFECRKNAVGFVRVNEQSMYLAFREEVLDIVREPVTARPVRVCLAAGVAEQSY